MYSHHQHHQQFHQQQQQFQQHLRQLQQLFQHQQPAPPPPPPPQPQQASSRPMAHHHHHQGGRNARPISAPAQAPPPHMVRMCSASQTTIMAANPMLQGALLMQQMQGSLRGFAVGGQQFTPFFPAGSRPSLLGPAPMGVAIKSPRMGFPPRHCPPQAQHYNKDFALQQTERRQENELSAVGTANGQSGAKNTGGESNVSTATTEGAVAADRQTTPSAPLQEQPALKRQRIEGSEVLLVEPSEANAALSSDYTAAAAAAEDKEPADAVTLEEGESMAEPETIEFIEECRAPEMVGVGATLKVTIQQSSESRAFNMGLEEQSAGGAVAGQSEARESDGDAASKFFCYICSTTCHNQQSFQSHMNGLAHQQRMMEIQHMSNACLVTLLPQVRQSLESAHRDGEKKRWCVTCQTHFYGDLIPHRRTKEHKLSKLSSRPFCTVCKRHFRTPRKFVEHMKSPEHKQRVEELREEGLPEGLEELITVDAVGCFEGEEDYEEEPNEQEEEGVEELGHSRSQGGQSARREVTLEDMADSEEYDPDTQYGSSFVVPVAGFLCRLCRKFYHFESTARLSHCQSLTHFQNLQKYRALQRQDVGEPDPCTDGVEEMHTVTAEEQEDQKTDKHAMPHTSALSPGPANPCVQDRTVRSHDPSKGHSSHPSLTDAHRPSPHISVTVSRPTTVGSTERRLTPGDRSPEQVDLTLDDEAASPPPPSTCPLQGDSFGEGRQGRAIPSQEEPLPEEGEEPAPKEQTKGEGEGDNDNDVAANDEKAATGCKQTTSGRRSVRMTQRR